MGSYSLQKIKSIVGGNFLQEPVSDSIITTLYTDSRRIVQPSCALFFAIETEQRDGHAFIKQAYEKGIRHFVIHHAVEALNYKDADFLLVRNTVEALQTLAAYHRQQFSYADCPVIGITGSNGKTIVKEWLYQLLHDRYHIVRSPKSYNSHIGVPLSVWQMEKKNSLAIFEAGISEKGEMEVLEKIIQPSIGIFTCIGDAHQEGFNSRQEKLEEKAKLFHSSDLVILPFSLYGQLPTLHAKKCITWGNSPESQLQIEEQVSENGITRLALHWKNQYFDLHLPFQDEASVQNALTCCCVCLALEVPIAALAETFAQLKPVQLRLEIKKGLQQSTLINDSYSADLTSFDIAFNLLHQQRQHERKTVILSDLVFPKQEMDESYQRLSDMIQSYAINRVIAVGKQAPIYLKKYLSTTVELYEFDNTETLLHHLHTFSFAKEAILIKGARSFELERVLPLLEQQIHETVLEINLRALSDNLKKIRGLLKPGVKTMAVVKAFGYGTGSYEVANLLQDYGVDYLTVAFVDEGVALRKAGITIPIMVMNAEPQTFDTLTNHLLEPELFSFSILEAFLQHLDKEGLQQYPVHLKIDTGMHRLGFMQHEWPLLTKKIQTPLLLIRSVMSHLVASEDAKEDTFTKKQSQLFDEACQLLQSSLQVPFLRHLLNSSGILRHSELQYEMVRVGIALYGILGVHDSIKMEEVMTFRSSVAQLKELLPGETVGYNRKGIIQRPSRIATVRVGYADGFPRVLSNGIGKMVIRGKEAPVVGNVCMDMTMLDVTDIPEVQEGDPVLIFGMERSITKLAAEANTIPYEIMTGISQRVKRIYVEE
jgi:alanine racemase